MFSVDFISHSSSHDLSHNRGIMWISWGWYLPCQYCCSCWYCCSFFWVGGWIQNRNALSSLHWLYDVACWTKRVIEWIDRLIYRSIVEWSCKLVCANICSRPTAITSLIRQWMRIVTHNKPSWNISWVEGVVGFIVSTSPIDGDMHCTTCVCALVSGTYN